MAQSTLPTTSSNGTAGATAPASPSATAAPAPALGFSTLERPKADPATASIPVVLISILPNAGNGMLLGAVDYLVKPLDNAAESPIYAALFPQKSPTI